MTDALRQPATTTDPVDTTRPRPAKAVHPARETLILFASNPAALAGTVILAFILAVSLIGPAVMDADPFAMAGVPMTPPELFGDYPLGTDYLGRDVLTGIVYGGRPTLAVGAIAAGLSLVIGIGIGALAGYFGGLVDQMLMKLTEFFQVLPALLFAMVLVTLFSSSLWTVAFAIGLASWPSVTRLTRAEFKRIRKLDYVTADRAIGATDSRLIWLVVLPNAMPPLIVSAALSIGIAILLSAGLNFLGLGDANTMTWGLMIGTSRDYILDAWWAVTIPGAAIFLTVLAISLIGDGLNDALNPKLRER